MYIRYSTFFSIIFLCILTSDIIKIFNFDTPNYNFHYELKEDLIHLNFNFQTTIIPYKLAVIQDEKILYTKWIFSSSIEIENQFSGNEIRFKIAIPSKPYSNELTYIKNYYLKPILFNPIGEISQDKTAFSWDQTKHAQFFYFQLYTKNGDLVKQYYVHNKTTFTFEKVQPGEYKWRVIPMTVDKKQGIASEWMYFTVSEDNLNVENIFGLDKDVESAFLNTTLNYPESAVIGPDGAIFVSDTLSHIIKRCVDGKCKRFLGTFIAGKTIKNDRLLTQVNNPGGIAFNSQKDMFISDIGNRRILKIESKTDTVSEIWSHGQISKNVYSEIDGSLTVLTDSGKILNNKKGQIDLKYNFYGPVAIARIGVETIVLDKEKLIKIMNNKVINTLNLQSPSSGLLFQNGTIFLGEHTTLYKIDKNFNKIVVNSDYANISHISKGRNDDEILVTDCDAGKVFAVNIKTSEKSLIIGAQEIVGGGIVDIKKHNGFLYILDNIAASLFKYDQLTGKIERIVGNGKQAWATIGVNRLESGLYYPTGFTFDEGGNIYIAEQHRILKISLNGTISLYTGQFKSWNPGFKDGTLQESLFHSIRSLYYDKKTNSLFVADTYNNRIRKIQNGLVSTIAGDGLVGAPSFGQKATLSHLSRPHDVVVDNGEIYIADSWNNIVSKVDVNGVLRHVAGKINPTGYQGYGRFSGDFGNRFEAEFNTPTKIFVYKDMIFVSDSFSNRVRLIKGDKISTVVGSNLNGYDYKDPNVLSFPTSIYVDDDFLYVADTGNAIVRSYKMKILNFSAK